MRVLSPDTDLTGKNVVLRVDFNVPLDKAAIVDDSGYLDESAINDDARIVAALPTIRALSAAGAKVLIIAHLGRPKGVFDSRLSLKPIASRLGRLLGHPVPLVGLPSKSNRASGDASDSTLETNPFDGLQPGEVALMENIRFDDRETSKEPALRKELAEQLSAGADVFVSDGFGVVHREQASVTDIAQFVSAWAGYLVSAEVNAFSGVLNAPMKPYVVILGGAKVSDKIQVIENLLDRATTLLIGGAMAYTFLKAQGIEVGTSLVEDDRIPDASRLLDLAKSKGVDVFLPVDVVVADAIDRPETAHHVSITQIPPQQMGLDIGPATVEVFADQIRVANTVVWNGPLGVFEVPAFAHGTRGIAQAVADNKGFSLIGGGDTAAAIKAFGIPDERYSHVSTGGGASLELLEGKVLPGLSILQPT